MSLSVGRGVFAASLRPSAPWPTLDSPHGLQGSAWDRVHTDSAAGRAVGPHLSQSKQIGQHTRHSYAHMASVHRHTDTHAHVFAACTSQPQRCVSTMGHPHGCTFTCLCARTRTRWYMPVCMCVLCVMHVSAWGHPECAHMCWSRCMCACVCASHHTPAHDTQSCTHVC